MITFNRFARTGEGQSAILKKMSLAIRHVLAEEFPGVTFKADVMSAEVSPLNPIGWKVRIRIDGQVTPLTDIKEEPPKLGVQSTG